MNYRLRSNQYTHKAWDLEQKGRRSEALVKARQAVSQDPTNTSARHTLAMLLLREGKYNEAERELTTIIALNPHHSASWEDLGGLYLFMSRLGDYEILMQRLEHEAPENLVLRIQYGHYLLLNRRYPDAERYLQHVLLEDPHNIKAHWYLGLIHQARGRLGWAIREFHEALHADFCDKNIILDLSMAYLEVGETEKALQLLKKLRFDYPHDPEVNALLASTLLDLSKEQEAFEILYHLKARYSQDAMSYVYLAEAEAELGHNEKANTYLITAEKLAQDAAAWSRIAQVYEYMDEFALGRTAAERALEAAPRMIENYVALANILMEMDLVQEAMSMLRRGLKVNPRDAELHFLLGDLLAEEGEFFEARIHFEQAIRSDYEYQEAYMALGILIMEQMGLADKAADVLETGLLWGESEPLRSSFAEALREQGRFAEAETILREMLVETPDNPGTMVQLGNLLFETNRRIEARAFFERAMELEPEWSMPYHGLGCCLFDGGQRELGLDYLRMAAGMGCEPAIEFLTELGEWHPDPGTGDKPK